MRVLLFLIYIGLGLTACDSFSTDSGGEELPNASIDVISPILIKLFPEGGSTDIDVDSEARFTFSELMDIRSLSGGATEDGDEISEGIKLYSGKESNDVPLQPFDERPHQVKYTQVLIEGIDPVTNNKIDVDATGFSLRHESGRFAFNTDYSVFITEDVQDLAGYANQGDGIDGNKLGETVVIQFTTEDGEWKDDESIQLTSNNNIGAASTDCELSDAEPVNVEGDQFEPSLASNESGDILAVWRQNNQGGTNDAMGIWTSRYEPLENKWSLASGGAKYNAQRIDDVSLTTNAFGPKIAINKYGKAVATWYQAKTDGAFKSIWVSVFDEGPTTDPESYKWSCPKPVVLEPPVSEASSPEIGIDDEGNVLSVWLELEEGVKVLKSIYLEKDDAGWSNDDTEWTAEPLSLNLSLGGDAKQPAFSYSSDGIGMVVWSQEEADVFEIYASRFVGGVWGEPERLNLISSHIGESNGASHPKISISENNDVFAIWQQHDGKRENIWVNHFSGGVWGDAFKMESDNIGDAFDPFIVFGPENVVFAAWVQTSEELGKPHYTLNFRTSSVGTAWGEIEEIDDGTIISKPNIAFDFEGNAVAVWVNDGIIKKTRYSQLTSSWGGGQAPFFVSKRAQPAMLTPILKDGRFISIWTQFQNGSFNLVSALFTD